MALSYPSFVAVVAVGKQRYEILSRIYLATSTLFRVAVDEGLLLCVHAFATERSAMPGDKVLRGESGNDDIDVDRSTENIMLVVFAGIESPPASADIEKTISAKFDQLSKRLDEVASRLDTDKR